MKTVEVGTHKWENYSHGIPTGKRMVSELNKEMFDLFTEEAAGWAGHSRHIGYADIGYFVDLLEQRYDIKKKENVK